MTLFLPLILTAVLPLNVGVGAMTQFEYTCADIALPGTDWVQNWSMFPPVCPGIEPVCQCWGLGCFTGGHQPACSLLLMWNEPSIPRQANITPAVGAQEYLPALGYAVEHGLEISTPCDSISWLNLWAQEWKAAHGFWPPFDRVCGHVYPAGPDVQSAIAEFKTTVREYVAWSRMHGGDGRVILHEYAYWPAWSSEEDAALFIREVKPWLEAQDIPAAWFALSHVGEYISPWHDTSLVEDGTLTQLGQAYNE